MVSFTANSSSNSTTTTTTTIMHHVMILVHGIMGNPKELGYVQQALERDFDLAMASQQQQQQQSPDDISNHYHMPTLLVHAAACNAENSLDGIEAGGLRLAQEVNDILQQLVQDEILASLHQLQKKEDTPQLEQQQHVIALSFLGFSLGGMYSRYALPFIDWTIDIDTENEISIPVVPNLFVSAATPHLGIQRMTYWKLPACLEPLVAWYLGRSGQDLFRRPTRKRCCSTGDNKATETTTTSASTICYDDIIQQMSLDPKFLLPLSKFSKRIAIANAFSTDFAVHTATAAFLTDDDDLNWEEDSEHNMLQSKVLAHYLVENESSRTDSPTNEASNLAMSKRKEEEVEGDVIPQFPTAKFTTSRSWSYDSDTSLVSRQPSCDNSTNENNHQHEEEEEETRHCQRPLMERPVNGSLSDMASSLNSLGWTKVFVDVRPHIPALWVRPKSTMKEIVPSSDSSQGSSTTTTTKSSRVFSPSALKRLFSGKGFDFNTLPFGHSFLVASTKNWWYTWFYREGRKFVDQVVAKELVEEILLLQQ